MVRSNPRSFQIRPAVATDPSALAPLAAQVFRETYGTVIPETILGEYLERTFTPAAFHAALCDTKTTLFVAQVGTHIGGYCKLSKAALPNGGVGEPTVELTTLYIARRYQGQGMGKALLAAAVDWAAPDYSTMWLCVWIENQPAVDFYQRHGFATVGTTAIVVAGRNPDDRVIFQDWVMQRAICPTVNIATDRASPSPTPASTPRSLSITRSPLPPTPPTTAHSATSS